MVARCLSIAASDSGGGAGIQADLKAFAAAGCYGASVVTAVTAQNTLGIRRVDVLPAAAVQAQLQAVLEDIGADAIKTGALLTEEIVDVVADGLAGTSVPLVVDPVLGASADGTPLLDDAARSALVRRLFPRASVVTPNLPEAAALAGGEGEAAELAERLVGLGARAALVTGGHGGGPDHLYDGARHLDIPVNRVASTATHGSGCTHSATLAALLARGASLEEAARAAAGAARRAIAQGLHGIGGGDGPVDVLGVASAAGQAGGDAQRRRTSA